MCRFIYIKSAQGLLRGLARAAGVPGVDQGDSEGLEGSGACRPGQRHGASGLWRGPSRRPRSGSSVERILMIYALLCMCAIFYNEIRTKKQAECTLLFILF